MTDVFNPEKTDMTPVSDLVGDGKKFKTVDDLARGKLEADNFIDQLKRETEGLREELKNRTKAEEELNGLREEIKNLRTATTQASRDTNPSLTADSIRSLVSETITQADRNRTTQQNINTANDAMVKSHGDLTKAGEAVKARAADLGISMDHLRNIAAESPTAFLKIMGETVTEDKGPLNTQRSVNTDTSNSAPAGEPTRGTKAFYDKLRVEKPNVYWSPKIQQEVFEAAKAGTYDLN